jgi:hypothetical protein
MKKKNKKLDKNICIKCNSPIHKVAEGGGTICYICSKCQIRYCYSLYWEMYNEKTCEYDKV